MGLLFSRQPIQNIDIESVGSYDNGDANYLDIDPIHIVHKAVTSSTISTNPTIPMDTHSEGGGTGKLCIVGISGAMNVGKDLMAIKLRKYLIIKNNGVVVRFMSFGSFVKEHACKTFGINLQFIEDWKRLDVHPPTFNRPIRELLQHVGDFRVHRPNIWVDKLEQNLPSEGYVIVTDVRYWNELQMLLKYNAYMIGIHRPSVGRSTSVHSSEQELASVIESQFAEMDVMNVSSVSKTQAFHMSTGKFNTLVLNNDDGLDKLSSVCMQEVDHIINHFRPDS